MRLIDADALKKALYYDVSKGAYGEFMDGSEVSLTDREILQLIDEQPTIDAVSDKHCKNVGTDYADVDQFVCSECGIELYDWVRVERDLDDGEVTHHEYVFRYCPHCGARIDEE